MTVSVTTVARRADMPKFTKTTAMPSLTHSSDSFTTPSVGVPSNHDNPYIHREYNPSGTVFIAVGCIVGLILLAFVLFHLFKSMRASRLAKRSWASEQRQEEKFHNGFYSLTASNSGLQTINTEYRLSVAKLPLLNHQHNKSLVSGIDTGDQSTLYASEAGGTSRTDLTNMFVSPTAEVMAHKRNRSASNLGLLVGSTTNFHSVAPSTSRHSQVVPSLYLNGDSASDVLSSRQSDAQVQPRSTPGRAGRETIPSMYLDDLIEK